MKKSKKISFGEKIFFRRWQNKPYSIFNTLGKIVIILTLPVVYFTTFQPTATAQDTVNLQEIRINSPKKTMLLKETNRSVEVITSQEIRLLPADNLSVVLKNILGIDVRSRGTDEVQADLSIRGGTFDQVLIMINGVPVNNAQTGHNAFSLPVDASQIDRIEVLKGAATRLYGVNAYTGVINIITKKHTNFDATIEAGQFDYKKLSLAKGFSKNNFNTRLSASYTGSDGFTTNTDFDILKFYNSYSYDKNNFSTNLQLGTVIKNYGALNFYTADFPFQYEAVNNQIASLDIKQKGNITHYLTAYYTRFQDKFELFRQGEGWYQPIGGYFIRGMEDTAKYAQSLYIPQVYYKNHNYHLTQTFGVRYFATANILKGSVTAGFDFRNVNILSNVLGKETNPVKVPFEQNVFYSKSADYTNINFSADYNFKSLKNSLSAGIGVNLNSMFGTLTSFGFEISRKFGNISKLYLSVNQGVRLPTFTDLYYSGPANQGNENLKPEKAISLETGYKLTKKNLFLQTCVFVRLASNTIDWVMLPDSTKWQTMNYTKLNTYGFEFSTKLLQKSWFNGFLQQSINASYTYLFIEKPKQEYSSKYVLDYPANNLNISIINHIKSVNFSFSVSYLQRTGYLYELSSTNQITSEEFSPYLLVNAKLSYQFKNFNFFIMADNLTNARYQDLSYVLMPGRWIKTGISVNLK